jgi:ankyrin repeat protein
MTSVSPVLELKHHVINGRLTQAKKLLTVSQISLEDCCDEDSNTALHWCAQGLGIETEKRVATDVESFVFLLQNGAPKNRQNALGETPLLSVVRMAVAEPDRAELLVEEMLKKGLVDPSRADMSGETPLMEAAAAGLEKIGRLLLEHRANPLAESASGLTAAQLASESDCEGFVKLLKSPLAERAAKEARQEDAQGKTMEQREKEKEEKREQMAKKFEQTLFGQKMHPGLARDSDRPGKPYPEYGTLHDID